MRKLYTQYDTPDHITAKKNGNFYNKHLAVLPIKNSLNYCNCEHDFHQFLKNMCTNGEKLNFYQNTY